MIYFNNYIMNTEQTTGNTQLNTERGNFNQRVSKFMMLGKSKKVQWDSKRRNRTI
jgi:hypothetical protein